MLAAVEQQLRLKPLTEFSALHSCSMKLWYCGIGMLLRLLLLLLASMGTLQQHLELLIAVTLPRQPLLLLLEALLWVRRPLHQLHHLLRAVACQMWQAMRQQQQRAACPLNQLLRTVRQVPVLHHAQHQPLEAQQSPAALPSCLSTAYPQQWCLSWTSSTAAGLTMCYQGSSSQLGSRSVRNESSLAPTPQDCGV